MPFIVLEAIIAGLVSGVVVAAFFIAIDHNRSAVKATASGLWAPPGETTSLLKQIEAGMRPITSRLPALAAGQLRDKLSRAGDPGALTPNGFQALRYGLGALLAIIGPTLGCLIRRPPTAPRPAPVAGD